MTIKVKIIPCYGFTPYEEWERQINEFLSSVGGFPAKVDFVSFGTTVFYAVITYQDS